MTLGPVPVRVAGVWCPVSEQKILFDRRWKLTLLSDYSEILILWLRIYYSRTKYAIMKKN